MTFYSGSKTLFDDNHLIIIGLKEMRKLIPLKL